MMLDQLKCRRAALTAAILRRDRAGDLRGGDARMPVLRRLERAIYRRLEELDARRGAA